MYDICCMLTSWDRPQRLLALLKDIRHEAGEAMLKVFVCVVNDGSTLPYNYVDCLIEGEGWQHIRKAHGGKERYWETITAGWQACKNIDAKFWLQVPDDIRLTAGFFFELIRQWHAIENPNKLCLDPLLDLARLKHCSPRTEYYGGEKFYRVMWNDCCFFGERRLMDVLEWTCHNPERAFQPGMTGSGVGSVITQKIIKADGRMYRCATSLVTHGAHQSRMHPTRGAEGDTMTTERITAGMATYASAERLKTLPKVLKSIAGQVNELMLWWNGPGAPPAWIAQNFPNVDINLDPRDNPVDLADMGKFSGAFNADGYFLLCDDDIIYGDDYVAKILLEVEAYNRKAIVGYHGIRLKHWPLTKSYYHERTVYHNQQALGQNRPAHILGTCAVAWHTSIIDRDAFLGRNMGEGVYMADLWFGRLAQDQHIPMVCLKHPAKVFQILPHEQTIFNRFYMQDSAQAALVNEKPWQLFDLPARLQDE